MPKNSPPLLFAATTGATPFRVNLHVADLGHTLMCGPSGAGKSTALGLIAAQWFRYGYAGSGYFTQYRGWSQTSLDTTLGALRAAGLQGQQLQSEQSVLTSLRSMAQTSDGRMEALQVMGQISEQQVQQLMKLRELMMADMSSKQSYQAAMIQKQAAGEAATERFFKWTPEVSDGTKFQSGWK